MNGLKSGVLRCVAILIAPAIVLGCSNTDPGTATLADNSSAPAAASAAQDRIDTSNLSAADVAAIAKNRKKMSCIELSSAAAQARALESSSAETVVADAGAATTSSTAKAAPVSNAQLIEEELACHCDRGLPFAGYELYERRENLMQLAKFPGIRPELTSNYPKDKGAPRFLRFGELLSDDALKKLPVVAPRMQSEACNSQCKATRAKENAAAKEAGQSEPWPNLEAPKAMACLASPDASGKSKSKKTE